MTTRYTEEQIKDIAEIIADEIAIHPERPNRTPTLRGVARTFADLFAADNPSICQAVHGPGHDSRCERTGGFNRKQFLETCGLKEKAE